MSTFGECSFDIQDVCDEKELVKICIQGMFIEYAVHLENLNLCSFAMLVENARRTNNSISKQRGDGSRFGKRTTSVNSAQEERPRDNKKSRSDKPRGSTPTLTFPCSMGKVYALLDQWIRDKNIKLPWVERLPGAREKGDPKFCKYHRSIGHPTKYCWTLKKIFNDRVRSGELVIENNDVRNNPLPAHNAQRGTANVATHDPGTEREVMPEIEAPEDKVTSVEDNQDACPAVAALIKTANFRKFFDLLGFNEEARFAAATALTQISEKQYGECSAAQPVRRMANAHENAILFTDADMCVKSSNHNRPLYVESMLNGHPVKRTFIDNGASLNIMPMSTFKAAKIDVRRLVKQPISINGFTDRPTDTIGYVNVDFKVGPIHSSTKFHVIEAPVSYHLLVGRKWLHDHNLIPSTLHQCIKGHWKGKDVFIPATKNPFEYNESYLIEAGLFDEYADEGETAIARPSGTPLPTWEEAQQGQQQKRKTRGSPGGKRKRKELLEIESFVREDGQRVYLL